MSKPISARKVFGVVLLPFLLTLLSLGFAQGNGGSIARVNPRGICLNYPNYDLKSGFPLAFLYQDNIPGERPIRDR